MAAPLDGSIWPLVVQRARISPSLPCLTSIDAAGMRTELSGSSMLNAVAKTSGALVTEAELEPGARIAMHLPWHWQRVVWTLAAWNIGAVIVDHGAAASCELLVADLITALEHVGTCEPWVVSMHPLGLVDAAMPNGVIDATSLCRMQPDALLVEASSGDGPALVLQDGTEWTRAQALAWTTGSLGDESRVLIEQGSADVLAGWAIPGLHPLSSDGAVIMCDGQDAAVTAAQEGATRIWV